ncbi:dienelactone hydrolase family protein [Phycisphaerales bacterium ac7]
MPICGGYPHHPYVASTTLASMPIWAFHGDADDIVPLRATTEPIEAIRQAGGKPKLTVYPGVGHVSWVPAYDTPELWEWLFEQRLRPAQ